MFTRFLKKNTVGGSRSRPRRRRAFAALSLSLALLGAAALAAEDDGGWGDCGCEAKHSSPTRAGEYLERAKSFWPGNPKEAWLWTRIALSFDRRFAEARALAAEVEGYCRAAGLPLPAGCDFVLRGAARPPLEEAPE